MAGFTSLRQIVAHQHAPQSAVRLCRSAAVAAALGVGCGHVNVPVQRWGQIPADARLGMLAPKEQSLRQRVFQFVRVALHVDGVELEDARWFSRDEALAMLDGRHPDRLNAPHPLAIAHHILRAWVDA